MKTTYLFSFTPSLDHTRRYLLNYNLLMSLGASLYLMEAPPYNTYSAIALKDGPVARIRRVRGEVEKGVGVNPPDVVAVYDEATTGSLTSYLGLSEIFQSSDNSVNASKEDPVSGRAEKGISLIKNVPAIRLINTDIQEYVPGHRVLTGSLQQYISADLVAAGEIQKPVFPKLYIPYTQLLQYQDGRLRLQIYGGQLNTNIFGKVIPFEVDLITRPVVPIQSYFTELINRPIGMRQDYLVDFVRYDGSLLNEPIFDAERVHHIASVHQYFSVDKVSTVSSKFDYCTPIPGKEVKYLTSRIHLPKILLSKYIPSYIDYSGGVTLLKDSISRGFTNHNALVENQLPAVFKQSFGTEIVDSITTRGIEDNVAVIHGMDKITWLSGGLSDEIYLRIGSNTIKYKVIAEKLGSAVNKTLYRARITTMGDRSIISQAESEGIHSDRLDKAHVDSVTEARTDTELIRMNEELINIESASNLLERGTVFSEDVAILSRRPDTGEITSDDVVSVYTGRLDKAVVEPTEIGERFDKRDLANIVYTVETEDLSLKRGIALQSVEVELENELDNGTPIRTNYSVQDKLDKSLHVTETDLSKEIRLGRFKLSRVHTGIQSDFDQSSTVTGGHGNKYKLISYRRAEDFREKSLDTVVSSTIKEDIYDGVKLRLTSTKNKIDEMDVDFVHTDEAVAKIDSIDATSRYMDRSEVVRIVDSRVSGTEKYSLSAEAELEHLEKTVPLLEADGRAGQDSKAVISQDATEHKFEHGIQSLTADAEMTDDVYSNIPDSIVEGEMKELDSAGTREPQSEADFINQVPVNVYKLSTYAEFSKIDHVSIRSRDVFAESVKTDSAIGKPSVGLALLEKFKSSWIVRKLFARIHVLEQATPRKDSMLEQPEKAVPSRDSVIDRLERTTPSRDSVIDRLERTTPSRDSVEHELIDTTLSKDSVVYEVEEASISKDIKKLPELDQGRRPRRKIRINRREEAWMPPKKEPEDRERRKIWLIMGKPSTWNIWPWKKTR